MQNDLILIDKIDNVITQNKKTNKQTNMEALKKENTKLKRVNAELRIQNSKLKRENATLKRGKYPPFTYILKPEDDHQRCTMMGCSKCDRMF